MIKIAAAKANYLILYKNSAQVYSATNLETAIKTPLPKGCKSEDRTMMFLSYLPDEESLSVFVLTDEQIQEESEKLALKTQKKEEAKAARTSQEMPVEQIEEEDVEEY